MERHLIVWSHNLFSGIVVRINFIKTGFIRTDFIKTDFARICRNRCIRTDVEGSEREDGTGNKRRNTHLSK